MVDLLPKAAAFWLGSLFLFTGGAKLVARNRWYPGAVELLPRRIRSLTGQLLPWVEVGTAGLLLAGVFPWGPLLAGGLGLGFCLVALVGLLRRVRIPCGCGPGRDRLGPITLARAIAICGAAGLLLAAGPDGLSPPWPVGALGTAAGLSLIMLTRLCPRFQVGR
jgi:hypothetical protein